MAKSNTTLRQIAESANVSIAAVSYTLHGKPGVSDAKRHEIQRLLEASGLKARHLRKPALYICNEVSVEDMMNITPFFQKYQGLNHAFHQQQVTLRLEFINPSADRGLTSQLQELASHKAGAVVLDSNLGGATATIAEFFTKRRAPVVQIGHVAPVEGADAVIVDDFSGAYTGTRHLIEQGHTKIATIRWNVKGDAASAKKHAGFTCAMEEAGLVVRPEYVVEAPAKRHEDVLTGRVAVEQLLGLDDPPTAVFVENTFVSASLMYPIKPDESCLPPDIAALDMVHFEASDLGFIEQVMKGVFCYPPRNTKLLQINWQQMGRVAAKRVVDLISGGSRDADVVRLAPRLVAVDSVKVAPL